MAKIARWVTITSVDLPDAEVQFIVKETDGKKGIMAGRRKIINHDIILCYPERCLAFTSCFRKRFLIKDSNFTMGVCSLLSTNNEVRDLRGERCSSPV
mmetsp:Transcript_15658/g.29539  ORF Transcript_15658/g.29539 Transcript_15658/m.29539 type:complete len:98 (-) Transcript_15658:1786-2079(-)